MKTDLEVLIEARALIEKGWTQGTYAKNAANHAVQPFNPEAVCWCASGAALVACGVTRITGAGCQDESEYQRFLSLWGELSALVPGQNIVGFNDAPDCTKEEVLAVFDQLIEAKS